MPDRFAIGGELGVTVGMSMVTAGVIENDTVLACDTSLIPVVNTRRPDGVGKG